jgi:hypothetical protein
VAAGLLVALTACTSSSGSHAGGLASPSPAVVASGTPVPASSSPVVPSPSASPAGPVITVIPTAFSGDFSTPSGNIACHLTDGWVNCRAKHEPWRPAPKTETCNQTWHTTIDLHASGEAALRGDCYEIADVAAPPLAYGHAFQLGRIRCASLQTELECLVVDTHRGFTVNRSSYHLTAATSPLAVAPAPPGSAAPVTVLPVGFAGGFSYDGMACDMSQDGVGCIVNGPTGWKPPPRAHPCTDQQGDTSTEVHLDHGVGRAVQTCRFDSNSGGPPLAAGRGIRIGSIECLSRQRDLKCTDLRSRHGFVVSTAHFRAF